MDHSKELRTIADDIVKTEAGGLDNSQYWGLRLRVIADIFDAKDAPLTSQSSGRDKEPCKHKWRRVRPQPTSQCVLCGILFHH